MVIDSDHDSDDRVIEGQELRNKLVQRLEAKRLQGTNKLRFMEAANELGIPWYWVSNIFCQYGWGKRQVWFNGSILDSTPSISVALARNKRHCALLLRLAGLPVPAHALVKTVDEAKKAADRFGYPVVIKPVNMDVGAGLRPACKIRNNWGRLGPKRLKLANWSLLKSISRVGISG